MAIYRLTSEPALPSDTKRIIKKPTITLSAKPSQAGKPVVDRAFSTRAKDAARRSGRTLFEPVAPAEKAVDPRPPAGRAPRGEPDNNAIRRRRATEPAASAATSRGPRADNAGRTDRNTRSGRGDQTPNAGAAASPTTSRRSADARADLRRPADARRSTEPRRGGKMRDQRDRSAVEGQAAPVVKLPPREPDGMMRVSKLLSEQGLCSRREADSYIVRGWVLADGVRITELGTRVLTTTKLTLDREAAAMQEMRMTILMNKPIGYVSGQAEDGYQPASVLAVAEHQVESDDVKFHHEHRRGLAPAGRLDIDSTGLLVLTQDGRIAKQLIGENSEVDKEYLVRVEGKISERELKLLNHGLSLDGEVLKPAIVRWQNEDQLNFILREGKKRQIRRMCEAVGLTVTGLKRIRIGKIKLGDLPVGKWRFLGDDESF